ncbi:alanine racemase [Streptomyces sp. TRM 70351]|uniref:alanine racemase n=1 Tax=Streptomyces sp. TRM 70351 TaxID=3116552 RepID=UPI002E7BC95D|nr:alanine racemase [Streptomyces sp. TRM 70351]MEE1930511.1 alanine racemase [Streptomyces sp. TRM 70351]
MSIQLPPSAAPRAAHPLTVLPEPVRARLAELARTRAPLAAYLYDPDTAAARARELRSALPEWAAVYYAVKANSFPGVLDGLAPHVDGFEVASRSELALARAALSPAGQDAPPPLVAAGPAKSVAVLTDLVRAQVEAVNAESLLELHRISRIAQELGTTARVALRVNPAHIPVTGSLRMGGEPSAFGVAEPDVPAVLEAARALPALDITGFHVHAASGNLDAEAHAAYVRWCVTWAAETARAAGLDLRHIDTGGGIGVAFDEGEKPFDVARFAELIADTPPPSGAKVILEPGRYLVADCGWYAAEVTDVKNSYGHWFAMLRGGINHFQLPTSWDIVHNITVLPVEEWPAGCPRPAAEDTTVTVVGELCTPEDTLLRDVRVGRLRAGDVVVFPNAGSYGWEFAMPHFLGHPAAERHLL